MGPERVYRARDWLIFIDPTRFPHGPSRASSPGLGRRADSRGEMDKYKFRYTVSGTPSAFHPHSQVPVLSPETSHPLEVVLLPGHVVVECVSAAASDGVGAAAVREGVASERTERDSGESVGERAAGIA